MSRGSMRVVAEEHSSKRDEPIDTVNDFAEFFEAERAGLYAALCIVTRNRHEAEEIAQDAFVALWERWDRVGALSDPTGYLYRTAMNAFRSRYRRAVLALRRTLR